MQVSVQRFVELLPLLGYLLLFKTESEQLYCATGTMVCWSCFSQEKNVQSLLQKYTMQCTVVQLLCKCNTIICPHPSKSERRRFLSSLNVFFGNKALCFATFLQYLVQKQRIQKIAVTCRVQTGDVSINFCSLLSALLQ